MFRDIGHSNHAVSLRANYLIGKLEVRSLSVLLLIATPGC
jgi:hypothetical protein